MNKEYKFYCKFIKPLEKKLSIYMILNSKFKLKYIDNKIKNINNKLIIYYKIILKNKNYQDKIIKELSN